LATKSAYQIKVIWREFGIYRHRRRRRRAPKHGSAWQIGRGPVSMLSMVTVLVGMMRGL
jgi:hypothetical protein